MGVPSPSPFYRCEHVLSLLPFYLLLKKKCQKISIYPTPATHPSYLPLFCHWNYYYILKTKLFINTSADICIYKTLYHYSQLGLTSSCCSFYLPYSQYNICHHLITAHTITLGCSDIFVSTYIFNWCINALKYWSLQ